MNTMLNVWDLATMSWAANKGLPRQIQTQVFKAFFNIKWFFKKYSNVWPTLVFHDIVNYYLHERHFNDVCVRVRASKRDGFLM